MPTTLYGSSRTRRWLLSSPPVEWVIARAEALLIDALRQGEVPKHIAFVMDGNRRFARNSHIETVEGHNMGFEALARVSPLPWALCSPPSPSASALSLPPLPPLSALPPAPD